MITPGDAELLRRANEARLADVHTTGPGDVTSYDAATRTASVQPMWKRLVPVEATGTVEPESYPELKNVSIIFPRSKKFILEFDLEPGDSVLLVCPERNPAQWRATGRESSSGDTRLHPLAGAVGIPGYFFDGAPPPFLRMFLNNGAIEVGDLALSVAIADKVVALLTVLMGAITAAAATEAGAGGLGGMTALNTALQSATFPNQPPIAATTLKAT